MRIRIIFLKNVFSTLRGFFGKKSEIFKFEKIKKYEEKKFRKQTLQSFQKAPKWRGGKYAGENRPSCYYHPRKEL